MRKGRRSANVSIRRWSVLWIVFLAFAWRIIGLDRQSLWRDEIDAIFFSLQDLPQLLSMFTAPGQNGALYFLALRPWFALVGSSEFALRFPSLIASVLSIPLMWQVGRKLMPGSNKLYNPPLLATLLLAANPYQLWYAQEGKMYALVTLMALLAAWFWLRGIERGGWQPWLGLLVTTSLAIHTHLLMVLLIPLFLVWFLLAWPQSRTHWVGFTLFLAGLLLPYIPLIGWQWPLLMSAEIRTALKFVPLGAMLASVLMYQSHSILPPTHFVWLVPFFVLGLYGLLVGIRTPSLRLVCPSNRLPTWRRHLMIGAWFIIPLLSIYLISLRQPVFMPRYVIWIAPALMMLVALGMNVLWQNSHHKLRPLLVLLLIYMLGHWGYIGWQEKTLDLKTDLRGAVRYVSQRRHPDELLILQIPHLELAYRYYVGDRGRNPFRESEPYLGWWRAGPWTNNSLSDDGVRRTVDEEMREKIAGASQIWVLQSEAQLRDERDLMGEWLNQNTTLIEEVTFYGTNVHLYRK